MEDTIQVQPAWFFDLREGKQLLECFRNTSVSGLEQCRRFHEILNLIKVEHGNGETKESRKPWNDNRVKLYDNLLPLALGAEYGDWMTWERGSKALELWKEGFCFLYQEGS